MVFWHAAALVNMWGASTNHSRCSARLHREQELAHTASPGRWSVSSADQKVIDPERGELRAAFSASERQRIDTLN
jgi:hypothetical protein